MPRGGPKAVGGSHALWLMPRTLARPLSQRPVQWGERPWKCSLIIECFNFKVIALMLEGTSA